MSYEIRFARFIGRKHAFGFWKGRVALYAILRGLGIGKGDEVLVPGYSCVMNINPILYVGAVPVYVDIEPNTFNINPDLIESAITPRTRVLIAQHTYGYPCDMDRIRTIADKHGLTVIEDCCLCLGSTWRGRMAGTFGKAAYFSSQWNKPYTTGLGGLLVTDDDALAERISRIQSAEGVEPSFVNVFMLAAQLAVYRSLIYPRTTALAQTLFRALTKKGLVVGSSSTAEFSPAMAPDFFKRMSCVQSISGQNQLDKLPSNIEHRRTTAALYDKLLADKGWRPRTFDTQSMNPVMVRYPVRIREKDQALAEAASAGVELGSWFECPLHPHETPLEAYGYKPGSCPQAELASSQTVNLPLHPRAGQSTARRSVDFITRFTQA
jgi:perosamine synthetase